MPETEERRPLGEIRRRAFLTIRALASRAEVSPATVLDIEHGRTAPRLDTIRKLSETLGIDPLEVAEFAQVIEGDTKKAAA